MSSVCILGADRIASSSASDSTIRIWNPRTSELLNTIHSPQKPSALVPFGSQLLLAAPLGVLDKDQGIQVWEISHGEKLADLPAFPGGVSALCAIDDRFLLVGTYGGLVLHLDLSAAPERRNFHLQGHERGVFSLAVIDRNYVASGSLDETIRIWNLASKEAVQILKGHHGGVTGLAQMSGRILASASQDQTIKLWDLSNGSPILDLHLDTGLSSLAVMPDGRTLVAGDEAGVVHFLRLEGSP